MDTILIVCVVLFVIRPKWVFSLILDAANDWRNIWTKSKKNFAKDVKVEKDEKS